jgi:hypothetical protein
MTPSRTESGFGKDSPARRWERPRCTRLAAGAAETGPQVNFNDFTTAS